MASPRGRWTPYLYLAPHALFFATFVLAPLVLGLYVSLNQWSLFQGRVEFVGLEYYRRLFDGDLLRTQYYWESVRATLLWVVISVPLMVAAGLMLALMVNAQLLRERQRRLLRVMILLPVALSVTVVAVLWRWLLLYDTGYVNNALEATGLGRVYWLTEQPGAWGAILLAVLWASAGWNMVFFLVGLQGIPRQIYEAAIVDGARGWQIFRSITLPNLKGILAFVIVLQIVGSFNLFGIPQLLTDGGPERTTTPVMMHIYNEAFGSIYPRLGSSTAKGFMTGLIMLAFVLIQLRLFLRRSEAS
jgi:multiple sugar transport system permease protein